MNRTIKMDVQFVRSLMGRIVNYEPVAGANHPQSVRASQVLLGEDVGGAAVGQHHSGQEDHLVGGHRLTQVVEGVDGIGRRREPRIEQAENEPRGRRIGVDEQDANLVSGVH